MKGNRAAVPFLDLRAQYSTIAEDLDRAVAGVVADQQFVLGPRVERFESAFASRVGAPHAIGVASGTDALLLSLRALDLPPGSEVVVPAFTFFATAGAVWNAGLRPVFAEVDAATCNLSRETVEAVLSDRTRAIVVVHLYGQMALMQPLIELARERGVAIVEDVAQAFGARQRIDGDWREAGSLTEAGAFSFFPTKVLGGFGDGGLVTSTDAVVAERVRKLRVHGGQQMYHHELVGTNSRLDALQAAVLSAKLPHVDGWIRRRREIAAAYDRGLAGLDWLDTPAVADGNEHVYNVYTVRTPHRDRLREHLSELGIGTNVYYPAPLHLQACFAELGGRPGDLPISEQLTVEVLSLPMFPEMTDEQVARVCEAVRSFRV